MATATARKNLRIHLELFLSSNILYLWFRTRFIARLVFIIYCNNVNIFKENESFWNNKGKNCWGRKKDKLKKYLSACITKYICKCGNIIYRFLAPLIQSTSGELKVIPYSLLSVTALNEAILFKNNLSCDSHRLASWILVSMVSTVSAFSMLHQ